MLKHSSGRKCRTVVVLLLTHTVTLQHSNGQKYGEVVVHDGPMGHEPFPWQPSEAYQRLQRGQVEI